MKFDSGREHARRMIGIFLVLVGMRGNFEGTRNRVTDGCSRRGGRRLCKEDVGWIVELKNFLASWSLQSDMVGRSARKMALAYGISCAQR